jgi:hydroxymethylbilane synthase
MNIQPIRIGTRGSQLALYQAEKVKATLQQQAPEIPVELVIIHSKGDKILDVALSKIGDKGLFTKELEEALYRDEIDMAVHSLKDLPTTLPEGLKLGGVLERGEVRDALVSVKGITMETLSKEHTIATSSLRRKAQLLKLNPELHIVDIRGNVNTRLRKMEEGHCDVMFMAAVGLQRLGLDNYISEVIEPNTIIPAVSQGAIAMETRQNDARVDAVVQAINHKPTFTTITAERIFLKKLEGGCQIPIGCYSKVEGDSFTMTGFMAYIDGTNYMEETLSGKVSESEAIASQLADYFISRGSGRLLERIRNANQE